MLTDDASPLPVAQASSEDALARVPSGTAAMLDAVAALVMVVDEQGRIVLFNQACEEATGYSFGEVRGQQHWALLCAPGCAEAEKAVLQRVRGGAGPVRHESTWRMRSGALRTIEWSYRPLSDGASGLVVCTGHDVTEQRQSEQQRREQVHFLQTLIDSIPGPLFFKDAAGRYLGCNTAWEQMMGVRREEIVGRDVFEISPEPLARKYAEMDRELFDRHPGTQVYESAVRFADGTVHDVIFYKATYADMSGALAGLIGVVVDISARKRAERALQEAHRELESRVAQRTAELREAKERAELADRLKGEFLRIASHELRTPLTALQLALQRSARQLQTGRPVEARDVERLQRYTQRLARMAGELIDVSRLERGLQVIHAEPLDLRLVADEVVRAFRGLAPKRSIAITLPPEPAWVEADAMRMEQVIGNLLDNALKYTPDESGIEVRIALHERTVELSVADQGPGIAPDAVGALFTRFYRVKSDVHQEGLGLGLYVCREIVQRHGGTIRVESVSGKGTRFLVELPRLQLGPKS